MSGNSKSGNSGGNGSDGNSSGGNSSGGGGSGRNGNSRSKNKNSGGRKGGSRSGGANASGGKNSGKSNGRGKQSSGKQQSGKQQSGKQRSGGASRKKRKDPYSFWGDVDTLPSPDSFDTTTTNTTAVVSSLGEPPLPGQGSASGHYFQLVYDRASGLAIALGHAGGLDDLTPEEAVEPVIEAPAEPATDPDASPREPTAGDDA